MDMQLESYWYNYKTEEYEYIETPEDFRDYIPQIQAAQGLYECYLLTGNNPIQAAMKVLECCVAPLGNATEAVK